MIDTVTLEITIGKRLDEKDFETTVEITNKKTSDGKGSFVGYQNIKLCWPVGEIVPGEYLPQVNYVYYPNPLKKKGDRRLYCSAYRITMSVPKFLYGNNIVEVGEDQFEDVVGKLYSKLKLLNLPNKITQDDIRRAIVRRVDFGKNIILPGRASTNTLASILERSEHRIGSRYAQVQYRVGDLYREGPKGRQLIVYDKIAEIRNTSDSLCDIEKLFIGLQDANLLQVVRVEVQEQNTKQLKVDLKSLNESIDRITFKDMFSADLARKFLMKYWGRLVKTIGTEIEPLGPDHQLEVIESLLMSNSPQKSFAKLGFSILTGECGLNKVKKAFCKYNDSRLWSRTKKELFVLLDSKVEYPYIQIIGETINNIGTSLVHYEDNKEDKDDEEFTIN